MRTLPRDDASGDKSIRISIIFELPNVLMSGFRIKLTDSWGNLGGIDFKNTSICLQRHRRVASGVTGGLVTWYLFFRTVRKSTSPNALSTTCPPEFVTGYGFRRDLGGGWCGIEIGISLPNNLSRQHRNQRDEIRVIGGRVYS